MTRPNWRTVVAAAIAASSLLVSAGAQAHDNERWEHERHERERYEHRHPHYYAPPMDPSLNFNFTIPLR